MAAVLSRINLLTVDDAAHWRDALAAVDHDFYHEAPYHAFCQGRGDGKAYLAVYQEGSGVLVWPYLLRPVDGLAVECNDVTSVYGYPGPLASSADPAFVRNALAAVQEVWREQDVVSAFTRLHPLLENQALLDCFCPAEPGGMTVAIDLTRSPDEIRRGYHKTLRHAIAKARNQGVVVERDAGLEWLSRFVDIYGETMSRNGAAPSYFFGLRYFEELFAAFPGRAHLFTATHDGDVIAGSVFVETEGIVQYHLSATDSRFLSLSPAKLLLDEARQWAAERGRRYLHLGGGRGGARDTLFSFKAAFSQARYPFFIWKSILQVDVYEELCRRRGLTDGAVLQGHGYFPAYRASAAAS